MAKSDGILFGVTGIGYGHTFRQLPVIEHFAKTSTVVIFAYGRSLEMFTREYAHSRTVSVIPVAVPFFVGSRSGLDFAATAAHPENRGVDFLRINAHAMARAEKLLGTPGLVVSDYEPVSAQYAYAHGSPLVTLDQQSKYLCADLPRQLGGYTFADEEARLRMFFPSARIRIALSFFRVPVKKNAPAVRILPPTIRSGITALKDSMRPDPGRILVYISSARAFPQSVQSLNDVLESFPGIRFDLFIPPGMAWERPGGNISVRRHGDRHFYGSLRSASGIIATAGHTLLSEAMFLGIPVYAVPVAPYEQFMNARVIADAGFGVSSRRITARMLGMFLKNRGRYAAAISSDRHILLRGPGQKEVIRLLESVL